MTALPEAAIAPIAASAMPPAAMRLEDVGSEEAGEVIRTTDSRAGAAGQVGGGHCRMRGGGCSAPADAAGTALRSCFNCGKDTASHRAVRLRKVVPRGARLPRMAWHYRIPAAASAAARR